MATIVRTPSEVFQNNMASVGKFCMTDLEAQLATEQFHQDTLQAIIVVSNQEMDEKEQAELTNAFQGWRMEQQIEKSWYEKLKDTITTAHEKTISWYEDWKETKKDYTPKTFEERVEEARITIAETRQLEINDPGYEC